MSSYGICSSVSQRGVVLVLSLLILLVLTIVGVAAMNSTMMQERMAGNTRTQTLTFEEASGGVSRALDYFYSNVDNLPANNFGQFCGYVHPEDAGPDDWAYPADGSFELINTGNNGGPLQLEQRMYCCQNYGVAQLDDGTNICIQNPSKLFVLNRGSFVTDDGRLAMREVEVRLDEADPDDPTCAICIPGEVGDFQAPNSGALVVHGACGPAITTQTEAGANLIIGAVEGAKPDNFHGGIVAGNMGSPWNSPLALAEFVFWAKLGLHQGDSSNTIIGGYFSGNHSFTGNSQFGTEAAPALTYIDGNLDMGGNIRGNGILIVRGHLHWNGTPKYDGLVITLGGDFAVGGGGGGGNPQGSFVATDLIAENSSADLMDRAVLQYRVAKIADPANAGSYMVNLYDPGNFPQNSNVRRAQPGGYGTPGSDNVPIRPVLVDSPGGLELIHYLDPIDGHRFFDNSTGSEVAGVVPQPGGLFQILDSDGNQIALLAPQATPPRDRFGRLIPEFVSFDNWPPDEYGFDPNEWAWQPPHPNCAREDTDNLQCPFRFGSSDLVWSGGGNQSFTYNCRLLQRLRHHFFCVDKVVSTADFPPEDYDYQDPDHASVCNHPIADNEYNLDIESLTSGINNHHAWHLWMPRCDCLGITGESDMILAGWRENLGWRDDAEFQGCASLTKAERCPGL